MFEICKQFFHLPGSNSVSRRVLQNFHFKLRNELDVPQLLPYLNKYHLITPDIHEQLLTLPADHGTKVDRLLAELPRRGERFLQLFIKCLRESVEQDPGTSHGRIADALEEELKLQNTSGIQGILLKLRFKSATHECQECCKVCSVLKFKC